uniref:CSON007895 protein n=1 Tax=Culicoides sonorensis TaxID=179676 RepID=A0A336M1T2_CULSO
MDQNQKDRSSAEKIEKVKEDSKKYTCDLCQKGYKWKCYLKEHIEFMHLRIRYDCKLCDKFYFKIDSLKCHEKSHNEKKYTCDVCGTKFHNLNTIKRHLTSIHLRIKESCEICGKLFHPEHLKNHINRIHLNIKPYSCEICKRKFSIKSEIVKHMNNIHLSESFRNRPDSIRCRYCTKYFMIEKLEDHIERKHKKLQCHLCEKIYFNRDSFKHHMKLHESSKFKCDFCENEFKTKSNLRDHILAVHLKQKSKCPICDKIFNKSRLPRHIKIVHNKEKNYSCDVCDKKFKIPCLLKQHITSIHLKQRNHKCYILVV